MTLERSVYLASRSPRRRELLAQIGVRFHLLLFRARPGSEPEVHEDVLPGEMPRPYVERLARAKAEAGWHRMQERNLLRAPVLAADTAVVAEDCILGKPTDRNDAARMLATLAGKRHEVLTAVALKYDDWFQTVLCSTEVRFRELNAGEIQQYLATGEADDKAGAYGIQGRAARFVAEIHGSYSNVVGLPLYETAQLLEALEGRRERRASF